MPRLAQTLKTFALAAFLLGTLLPSAAQSDLPDRFKFLPTHRLFERIRSSPGFDLLKPATFGFFFNSLEAAPLQGLRAALEKEDYVFVSTHVDKQGNTWVQLAKAEVHTEETMVERNRKLHALAFASGVKYDGWDITRNTQ
jgi:hypothetical protein